MRWADGRPVTIRTLDAGGDKPITGLTPDGERNPFLGVHHTVTLDGHTKIGPTAIPCFWREHYSGVRNFRLGEFLEVVSGEAELFLRNDFGFRKLAWEEMQKIYRPVIVGLAAKLVSDVHSEYYTKWGPPGIRAQLLDTRTRKLEMDFRMEGDDRSFHILNAVSPAFTCAMTFSEYAFQQVENLMTVPEKREHGSIA